MELNVHSTVLFVLVLNSKLICRRYWISYTSKFWIYGCSFREALNSHYHMKPRLDHRINQKILILYDMNCRRAASFQTASFLKLFNISLLVYLTFFEWTSKHIRYFAISKSFYCRNSLLTLSIMIIMKSAWELQISESVHIHFWNNVI